MKTIEEVACEYRNKTFQCSKEKTEELAKSCLSGKKMCFLDGIKYAQTWISVGDELPETMKTVLLKDDRGTVSTGFLSDRDTFFHTDFMGLLSRNVTHWRPIELK